MAELKPRASSRKTLFTAVAVLVMLTIAVIGMCYSIRLLWTLPAKP
jgi:hypothetical protein